MAKYHQYIRDAVSRGSVFNFDKNVLVTPRQTEVVPKLFGTQRYPSFNISLLQGNKSSGTFPFHKFVAYILYGEESFAKGVHVRHLDGNTLNLSKENIVLGTASENELDKCAEVRKSSAKKARSSQGSRPNNHVVPSVVVEEILKDYFTTKYGKTRIPKGTFQKLSEKYGINTFTIKGICYGTNYKVEFNKIKEEFKNVFERS